MKLGRLRIEVMASDMNWHGPKNPDTGEFEVLRSGWKAVNLHVENKVRSYWGWRFFRYHPDGSWEALTVRWIRRGYVYD